MYIGRRIFSVSFLFLFSTYGSTVNHAYVNGQCNEKTEAQWLSVRVIDSRPRDSSLSRTGTTAFSALCP